jgi:hypothetical protein
VQSALHWARSCGWGRGAGDWGGGGGQGIETLVLPESEGIPNYGSTVLVTS